MKKPVTYALPQQSTAIPKPKSANSPPACFAQIHSPSVFSLATNISSLNGLPSDTNVVSPKVAVPLKKPVTYALPQQSTAIPLPTSELLPPARSAHSHSGKSSSGTFNLPSGPITTIFPGQIGAQKHGVVGGAGLPISPLSPFSPFLPISPFSPISPLSPFLHFTFHPYLQLHSTFSASLPFSK